MLSLPPSVRIYLCTAPTDVRRGFDGLAALARDVLQQDPLSGHLFECPNNCAQEARVRADDPDYPSVPPTDGDGI